MRCEPWRPWFTRLPSMELDPLTLLALAIESEGGAASTALVDATSDPPREMTLPQLISAASRLADRIAGALARGAGAPEATPSGGQPVDPPFVAVVAADGPLVVIGPLAALLAGCAFVLCDPASPAERLRHVLHDTAAAAALVPPVATLPAGSLPEAVAAVRRAAGGKVAVIEADAGEMLLGGEGGGAGGSGAGGGGSEGWASRLRAAADGSRLACVCYTSGSALRGHFVDTSL